MDRDMKEIVEFLKEEEILKNFFDISYHDNKIMFVRKKEKVDECEILTMDITAMPASFTQKIGELKLNYSTSFDKKSCVGTKEVTSMIVMLCFNLSGEAAW